MLKILRWSRFNGILKNKLFFQWYLLNCLMGRLNILLTLQVVLLLVALKGMQV
ncbi:hypothetical protein D1872_307560 [compost metagenome]